MDSGSDRLAGTAWRVVEIAGSPAALRLDTTLELSTDGAHGRGGVNLYRGGYRLDGDRLSFEPVMSTLMAGPDDAMDQEHRWFHALGSVTGFRRTHDELVLLHDDGTESRLVPQGPFVTVSGQVTYRQRIAMLPGSIVWVRLEDQSRADAAADVIAQQLIDDPGNVPVPFELTVDRSRIEQTTRLGLRASIEREGHLIWTTDTSHSVDLGAEPVAHELVVRPLR